MAMLNNQMVYIYNIDIWYNIEMVEFLKMVDPQVTIGFSTKMV